MSNNLISKKCIPCEGDTPSLEVLDIERLHKEVPEWKIVDYHHLTREFKFKNFAEALAFVNRVGALAEEEGHHPDIEFGWGYATVKLFTHAIGGLSENDFILAAKIDALRSPHPRVTLG